MSSKNNSIPSVEKARRQQQSRRDKSRSKIVPKQKKTRQNTQRKFKVSGNRTMSAIQPTPSGLTGFRKQEAMAHINAKTVMSKSIPLVSGSASKNYLRTLIDNAHFHSRFPDSDLRAHGKVLDDWGCSFV